MRIGYDAKRAFLNNTGLGNYSRWVIRVMAEFYNANTYILYTPKVKANGRLDFLKKFKNISTVVPKGKLFTSWWRRKSVVKDLQRDGVEIYHGLSHELPLGIEKSGIRSVVTVHDLIFMRFPQYFGRIDRMIYLSKFRHACRVADTIIAISETTKNDLVDLLKIDSNKIKVVYQGCDPIFSITQSDGQKNRVKEKYHLPDKFILNVGTIETRKNLLLLIKALPFVQDQVPLVVAGKPTQYLELVKSYVAGHDLTGRVFFLKDVDFADLPAIYQLASVFIYPSRYEGFGIPVLEALKSQTPVIAAKNSCLEEAGGPDSIYVDPDDEKELAKQISNVLGDETLQKQMVQKGLLYAQRFEDEKLAKQLNEIYENILTHA